jgi:hypothetical protein
MGARQIAPLTLQFAPRTGALSQRRKKDPGLLRRDCGACCLAAEAAANGADSATLSASAGDAVIAWSRATPGFECAREGRGVGIAHVMGDDGHLGLTIL